MKIRFATDKEITQWNDLIQKTATAGDIYQTTNIARLKQQRAWSPVYLLADDSPVMVHEARVPVVGKMWFLPKGPNATTIEDVNRYIDALVAFAKDKNVFSLKIEPEIPHEERTHVPRHWHRTKPVHASVSTVIIDLTQSEEDIMAAFNQGARRSIRKAIKEGVTVKQVDYTPDNARTMYELLKATGSGRFGVRDFAYYDTYWRELIEADEGEFFFATHHDTVVAAAFCTQLGKKAYYKDGASIQAKKIYGASHLLQWEMIRWMRERGMTSYDFLGVPPIDQLDNKQHPFYGIGLFKTSFNKTVTEYIGAYDIAVNEKKYRWWKNGGEKWWLRVYARLLRGGYWY